MQEQQEQRVRQDRMDSSGPRQDVVSRDPRTGEAWRRWEPVSPSGVRQAVQRARAAQPEWARRTLRERAKVLERFRRLLYDRRLEATRLLGREMGKPEVEALSEVVLALDFARFYARVAPRELKPSSYRPDSLALARKRVTLLQEPFGVVAVIAPWNYPIMLAAGHVLPALVAGNAVLLKPSELTTATGQLLGELLVQAGVPADVMQVLAGAGATGSALVQAEVDKVFFTGSEATGRLVAATCAQRMVPLVLELGGSDPAIVLDDADLPLAARGLTWGRSYNCGQSCVAPKRVFVEQQVYDEFVALLEMEASRLRAGEDVGPPVNEVQRQTLQAQLDDAIAKGAHAHRPGEGWGAAFFPPVVLTGVTCDMRVLHEETFGPILPVVAVRDDDDAVRRANETTFGLSASVWSRSRHRARAVANRLHAGSVIINDVMVGAGMADVPHGGVKASGTGRSHGVAGLRECVREKAVIEERLPGTPQAWWFGYSDALARSVDAFARMTHGPARHRAAALFRLGAFARRFSGRD